MPEPTNPKKSAFRELASAVLTLLVISAILGGIIWGCHTFKPKPQAAAHRCPYCGQEIRVKIEPKEDKAHE